MYPFMNIFKAAQKSIPTAILTGSNLTDDDYPTGVLPANYTLSPFFPTLYWTDTWVIAWTGTITGSGTGFWMNLPTTIGTHSGTIVSGGSGSGVTILAGTNGYFEFTIGAVGPTSTGQVSMMFQSGITCTGLTNIILCRRSHYASVVAGGIWNPDFLSVVSTQNPRILRTMLCTLLQGRDPICNTKFSYQQPLTSIVLTGNRSMISSIYGGACTNSGNAYSLASYPTMPVAWTDGECWIATTPANNTNISVQGVASGTGGVIRLTLLSGDVSSLSEGQKVCYTGYNLGGSNTVNLNAGFGVWTIHIVDSTHIELATSYPGGIASVFVSVSSAGSGTLTTATVDVGSRGAKLMVGTGTLPLMSGQGGLVSAGGAGMWVYDATQDVVFYGPTAFRTGVSLALWVSLCNALNKDIWYSASCYLPPAEHANFAAYAAANLKRNLNFYLQLSNEVWNATFEQASYYAHKGNALALTSGGPTNVGYVSLALDTALVMQQYIAAWSSSGRPRSTLKGVFGGQAVGLNATGAANALGSSLQGTGLDAGSNAKLSAYTGGISYNTSSNYPANYGDSISVAPYVGFNRLTSGLGSAAVSYASGDTTTAFAFLSTAFHDNWVNNYTVANSTYPVYEALAASFDSQRAGLGLNPLTIDCYEGYTQIVIGTSSGTGNTTASDILSVSNSVGTTQTVASFNIGSHPSISFASGAPPNGTRIVFSGGTLPSNLLANGAGFYFVINSSGNDCDISATYYNPTSITLTGSPSGTTTATYWTAPLDPMIEAWKYDDSSKTAHLAYLNGFVDTVTYPHNRTAAALQLEAAFQISTNWGMLPYVPGGSGIGIGINATPYKLYEALQQFNAS